ncbi:MAG: leucine-rich repeat domain-containing protein [Silvanigrellaceae bacterium]|nr:leucine-rich repeat domain-containing protein [Silvanigrellaceae bacterium]
MQKKNKTFVLYFMFSFISLIYSSLCTGVGSNDGSSYLLQRQSPTNDLPPFLPSPPVHPLYQTVIPLGGEQGSSAALQRQEIARLTEQCEFHKQQVLDLSQKLMEQEQKRKEQDPLLYRALYYNGCYFSVNLSKQYWHFTPTSSDIISKINFYIQSNLAQFVVSIDLSGTLVNTEILNLITDHFKILTWLNLSNNKITYLNLNVFSTLVHLKVVIISGNHFNEQTIRTLKSNAQKLGITLII